MLRASWISMLTVSTWRKHLWRLDLSGEGCARSFRLGAPNVLKLRKLSRFWPGLGQQSPSKVCISL